MHCFCPPNLRLFPSEDFGPCDACSPQTIRNEGWYSTIVIVGVGEHTSRSHDRRGHSRSPNCPDSLSFFSFPLLAWRIIPPIPLARATRTMFRSPGSRSSHPYSFLHHRVHSLTVCRRTYIRCAGSGWARSCGWAGSGNRARSPLAVAEVLAQWLEAHRR